MDWERVIRQNHEALLRVLTALFAAVGIVPGGSLSAMPRYARNAILLVLRPAESAARRLIVIVAHKMSAPEYEPKPANAEREHTPRGTSARSPAFRLIDPRKNFDAPSYWTEADTAVAGHGGPATPLSEDDTVNPERICKRLHALQSALDDLPGQARRMLRLMARRKKAPPGPGCVPPLRPGWPPGYRQRHIHPVDQILKDCHYFA